MCAAWETTCVRACARAPPVVTVLSHGIVWCVAKWQAGRPTLMCILIFLPEITLRRVSESELLLLSDPESLLLLSLRFFFFFPLDFLDWPTRKTDAKMSQQVGGACTRAFTRKRQVHQSMAPFCSFYSSWFFSSFSWFSCSLTPGGKERAG